MDDLTAAEHLLPGELRRPPAPPARSTRVAEAVVAARRLLEDEGPSALTMRRLADELGIRAPSLYKHFTGKAAVELALIEDALFDIGDVTHRALHEQATTGALRRLLSTYGMVILELDNRYPPGSDLESTWGAGAAAFDRSAGRSEGSEPAPSGATGPAPPRRS